MPEALSPATEVVTVSDTALGKMREILADPKWQGIRLGVLGGGCAGLQYQMEPAETQNPEDLIQEAGDIRFFIHPMVVPYLKGVHIDYTQALIDGGFKFANPNAASTCGCGTSFGV